MPQSVNMGRLRQWAIGLVGASAAAAIVVPALSFAASGWGPLIEAFNGTGQRLLQAFAKTQSNVVISPYSIGSAMAMVLAGARGDNAAEMARVLGQTLPRNEIDAANAAVLASLNGAASASFELRIANALMLTKPGNAIAESYITVLREKYAAEIFQGADLAAVNGWVKEKTNGKITSILDQLDAMTVLVLLDAIYFKARWQVMFDPDATRDEAFHVADGEAKVPTMHLRADLALTTRPGYQAIRLPYQGGRVSMVIVLPDPGNTAITQHLGDEEMKSLLAALRIAPRQVELALPRYHARFKSSLVDLLKSMGMHRAFDFGTADFSGMTGRPQAELPLAIGQIVHAAVIDVGEEGTEAAAATAATVVAKAIRSPPAQMFRVDRPFLFAIVDETTGAVLFEGRIADPRQAS
jgi:serine protease inhibitor